MLTVFPGYRKPPFQSQWSGWMSYFERDEETYPRDLPHVKD